MQTTTSRRTRIAVLSSLAIAAVVAATAILLPGQPGQAPHAVPAISAPSPMIGVTTGETQNGMPVYRLPTVAVTASRSEELAKMIQEDKLAVSK